MDSSKGAQEFTDRSSGKCSSSEEGTRWLLASIIRYLLCSIHPITEDTHDPSLKYTLQYENCELKATEKTSGNQKISTRDDGGISLMVETPRALSVIKKRVALFETQRQFLRIENDRPVIADNTFAQLTAQALATRLKNLRDPSQLIDDDRCSIFLPSSHVILLSCVPVS